MQKKQIFITGIAGVIGYHLANEGHDVFGIDSFNDYYSPDLKRKRAALLIKKGVSIYEGSLQEEGNLQKAMIKEPTHIVHLAAQAGVRYSYSNPDAYIESNLLGFYALLKENLHRKAPFIFASSSSVYGNSGDTPFTEEANTDHPASLYAATKKCNEVIAYSFQHQFGIPCLGLRFFTVYGPYGRPDMAYFSFTENLIKEKPITLYNKGHLSRDFTYIDDIINGIVHALSTSFTYEIVNLGNHHPCSVLEMLSILEELTGKKAIITHETKPVTDVEVTFADIDKAKKWLHFHPKTSLKQGLTQFYDWYAKDYCRREGLPE
jgi:UDP-glucuronate 4-epimerase